MHENGPRSLIVEEINHFVAVLLQLVILILGLQIVRIWVRTSRINRSELDSHEILTSISPPCRSGSGRRCFRPSSSGWCPPPHARRPQCWASTPWDGIGPQLSTFFCQCFAYFGHFYKLTHLHVEGVEPEVHLTVGVKVQLRHELNLTRSYPRCPQEKRLEQDFDNTLKPPW